MITDPLGVPVTNEVLFPEQPPSPLGRLRWGGTLTQSKGVPPMRLMGRYAVVLLLVGTGHYRDATGRRQNVSAGDLICVFPELPHSYGPLPGRPWDEVYLVFDGPVFDLLRRVGLLDPVRPVLPQRPASWNARLIQYVHRPRAVDVASRCAEVAELAGLLAEAGAAEEPGDRSWLDRAKDALGQNLAAPLDIRAVALALGMSPDGFRKRFAREADQSPGRFRAARRVAAAAMLLRNTSLTHRQVAAALGYSDEFHLARRFRQHLGVPPGAYRRSVQSGATEGDADHGLRGQ